MKNIIAILALTIVTILSTTEVNAQKFPDVKKTKLDKSPMDIASFPDNWRVSDKVVRVIYSRPQLKGRTLEKLAPKGKVWRTGANEAAEITFYKNVNFGGKEVKAGTYSLFTIPGEKEWTIILNTASNVWGAYTYKKQDDVLRVMGKVSRNDTSIKAFSIMFDKNMNMIMGWDKTVITVPIK